MVHIYGLLQRNSRKSHKSYFFYSSDLQTSENLNKHAIKFIYICHKLRQQATCFSSLAIRFPGLILKSNKLYIWFYLSSFVFLRVYNCDEAVSGHHLLYSWRIVIFLLTTTILATMDSIIPCNCEWLKPAQLTNGYETNTLFRILHKQEYQHEPVQKK